MRDYVIINGVNSLTINGLAISKLPPISKPLMRNMKEEIDGRDGDIITELGYSAYDKTMEIGLYGNFDINEVISFFNGEGTITFSNEDDKHYYFKILEQIDYEKLLKFKTATITFHCQPFKYPNNEQIIDVDSLTVEGTGTDITLSNTSLYAPINTELLGDTYQYTTTGRNLFVNSENLVAAIDGQAQMQKTGSGRECTLTKTSSGTASPRIQFANDFFEVNTTYYFSFKVKGNWNVVDFGTWFNNVQQNIVSITPTSSYQLVSGSFTYPSTKYTSDRLFWANTDGRIAVGQSITITDFMISKSNNTEYEPYTNGASPNPDYPQAIDNVEGEQEIIISNKNLFNFDTFADTSSGLTSTISGNNLKITGTATTTQKFLTNYIDNNFKVGSYVFSITKVLTARLMIRFFDSNNATISTYNIMPGETSVSLQLNGTEKKYRLIFNPVRDETYNVDVNIQLEHGTVSTSYEEYKEQSYEINLGKNLFDKDNVVILNANLSNSKINSNANERVAIIKCDPNTTYTFSKVIPSSYIRNTIATTSAYPTLNMTVDNAVYSATSPKTYTTGANAQYIVWLFWSASDTTYTEQQNLDSMQVEKGSQATSYVPYKTPIELCKIGDYQDIIFKSKGNQLYDKDNINLIDSYYVDGTGKIVFGTNNKFNWVQLEPNKTYTLSQPIKSNVSVRIALFNSEPIPDSTGMIIGTFTGTTPIIQTFTTTSTSYYLGWVYCNTSQLGNYTQQQMLDSIMLNEGTSVLQYEPYGTNGKWLLHKEIGKYTFTGNETFTSQSYGTNSWLVNSIINTIPNDNLKLCISNIFTGIPKSERNNEVSNSIYANTTTALYIRNTSFTSQAQIQSATNGNYVYYVLATPTTTEITDTELLAQLTLLSNATTYDEATNISSKGDLPSILNVSATSIPTTTITNIGNIYAKPLLTIKGSGDISVYLNGIQLLQIALGDREEITIDISKMEAYDEETKVLLNRLVIGDYSKFLINSGVNELLITGDVSNFTMSNYTRWL